jgi:hypothetical protein
MTTTKYRVYGTTDDTDTCEVCGKIELRSVVMLMALDADGNDDEIVYAGTTCAARKMRAAGRAITPTRVRYAATSAASVRARAAEFADEFADFTVNQYIAANAMAYLNANGGDTTAALAAARRGFADLQVEIAAIRRGDLAGTRFAKLLPVL